MTCALEPLSAAGSICGDGQRKLVGIIWGSMPRHSSALEGDSSRIVLPIRWNHQFALSRQRSTDWGDNHSLEGFQVFRVQTCWMARSTLLNNMTAAANRNVLRSPSRWANNVPIQGAITPRTPVSIV